MRKEVQFHYDREADVLYLSLGKPQKAKTIEIGEDFVLRLHPKNAQVVGMTIINFPNCEQGGPIFQRTARLMPRGSWSRL